MSGDYLAHRDGARGSDRSITAPADALPQPRSSNRCKLVMGAGSGSHFTDELSCLLRRRLRVAGLIALTVFAIFFIRGLFAPTHLGVEENSVRLYSALQATVVAILTVLSLLLWSRVVLSMRLLRVIELCLFSSMGLFFGYLQYVTFYHGSVLAWGKPEYENEIRQLATAKYCLPWFSMIVLYGTFIPNTWRRSATVVGIMTLAPLALTFAVCFKCTIMGHHTGPALFEMTVILSMAAAIAIFGSYKISVLEQEAFSARKLGQYRLVRRLGGGGMGDVYLGEHMLLRRDCAIKVIRADQAGDPVTLSRFEREVKAMATLTHWNTVEIYDYGHGEDGTFYYVMEYLPGLTLQDLVDQHGPVPPGRAVHFLRQICDGLREAHSIGLIHRDIKPRNVIACRRGGVDDVAKLLDFGLVQSLGINTDSKLTVQGTILGSPAYMSPEQAIGKGGMDVRTDIYAIGGLAYFLLTGQPPFPRDTAMEMVVAQVHDKVPPLTDLRPELPHDLEGIVLRCLMKDTNKRFQDIDSLDQALADCACAGGWDREQAAEWWREREEHATSPQEQALV